MMNFDSVKVTVLAETKNRVLNLKNRPPKSLACRIQWRRAAAGPGMEAVFTLLVVQCDKHSKSHIKEKCDNLIWLPREQHPCGSLSRD